MMEMKIKIDVPELVAAVEKLAAAIDKNALNITVPNEGTLNFNMPTAAPVAPTAPAAPAVPTTPVAPAAAPTTPPVASAPAAVPTATPAAPTAPAAPSVPVTAPTYTLDQIAKAGASLVDAGKMEQLLGLLTKYGVQAVTQLNPDQYGAFATELRALGAQI